MKSLLENRFQLAEASRNIWSATVPARTTREAILDAEYWSHVAQRLSPLDEIFVVDDDCAFRMHLIVIDSWVTGAKLQVLSDITLMSADETRHESGLRPRWRGPHHRWCIVREDGTIVRYGLSSKAQAQQEMVNQLAGMRG